MNKYCKRGHERTPENTSAARNCRTCLKITGHEWYVRNSKKTIERTRIFQAQNPIKKKAANAKRYEREVRTITPHYISQSMRCNVGLLSPEIIEIKRQTIKLWRALKWQ
jgi:hypothetical protein